MTSQTKSVLKEFYKDTSVFITGATGFLGKALLEKLLRSCDDIKTIFILIRAKKGRDINTRLDDLFDDPLFDLLKKLNPKFIHKIHLISGDCALPEVGMKESDCELLQDSVHVVFHVAATVKFDEKLPVASAINVRATQDVIKLCSKMRHLKSVVYVSTAYAACPWSDIGEKFYPVKIKGEDFMNMVASVPDDILEACTPLILGKWPNSYTFSKAISEDLVKRHGVNLPIGVFRPAIVTSTYKEPLMSWSDNLYGPCGLVAGTATGIVHAAIINTDVDATVIPVDLCVNALIASAWDISLRQNKKTISTDADDIPIYNFVSDPDNRLSWGTFTNKTLEYGLWKPTAKAIWFAELRLTRYPSLYAIYKFFLHILPALLIDGICFCTGRKQQMMNIYRKVHKLIEALKFFTNKQFNFTNDNVRKMWSKLSAADKEDFLFDMRLVNWDDYFKHYWLGIREYVLKDPPSTLPASTRRFTRFYWMHQTLKAAICIILLRILWSVMSNVYIILVT